MSEAKELEAQRAKEDLRLLQAEERRIERETFRDCDHDLKDITEERRGLIKGNLPSWVKHLIAKDPPDRIWVNRREAWRTQKYEKCTICGLLMISDPR